MTFGTTALWLGSTTHTTRVARNHTRAMFGGPTASFTTGILPTTGGGAHGVVGGGDLLVTATGGLNFSIAAGNAVMLGGSALAQGAYAGIYNDAALASAVGAHHATLPRKDIIAVRIRDTDEDASGSEDCGHVVIAGTAAGSPADPAIPANHLVLARANVPATSGAITVDDLRTFANALGGTLRVRSTTRPTGAALWEGLHIYETDTDRTWVYDGANWIRGPWFSAAGRTGFAATGSTQSIPNAALTSASFDVETFDSDGFITVPSALATVPSGCDGLYTITAKVNLTSACGGAVEIAAGGQPYDFSFTSPAMAPSATVTVPLSATQTIALNVYQALGSAQNVNVRLDVNRVGR